MSPLPRRVSVRVLAAVVVLLIGTAVAVSVDLPSVEGMRAWLSEGGGVRWAMVVLGVAVALLTPISRTALSVLVGAVAGFPAGLAVVMTGGMLGGLAGFVLSRWLGRDAVVRLAGARLARLDRAVSQRGFVSVLVARAMPVAPFVFVSYAAGLSGVRLGPYLLGTAVGLVPWSVLYVGVGTSVASIDSWTHLIPPLLTVSAVLSVVVLAGHFWRPTRRPGNQPGTVPGSTVAPPPG
ncbi:TVP38/TMEM64 family protein [Blastococcus sp. MG754426]|nr:TVP38/TMEM64 family protein [Blastococcus sp. MG754426]MCF6513492.1 TVP38/TMEM64 family protein [Blastococcus sp. MG754427]MCF6736131.1 TVP38/TMEM64 family protein [Blastococcus sp. KM273129]RBY92501.1 TVP38/TMEM64 family protein [Blastococcus sp. TF02-8]